MLETHVGFSTLGYVARWKTDEVLSAQDNENL